MRTLLLAVVLGIAAAACGSQGGPQNGWSTPTWFDERPLGSAQWAPVASEPAWVKSPPQREGWLRVVTDVSSNLRHIAEVKSPRAAELDLEKSLRETLGPIAGADGAAAALAAAKGKLTLVQRAMAESDGPKPEVPGNHLVTVWSLWEVPLDDLLAPLPPEKRDAARAALRNGDAPK